MKINTNTWNRIRYTIYTPIYDFIVKYFGASRKRSIEELAIKPGEKVLIIGAGTGLDLEFMPKDCDITATDITPSMIARIKKRSVKQHRSVKAEVMDGQALTYADNSFDKVILHLIVAVIPDPVACLKEAERVLKPGGQITIYDKFVRKNARVSVGRRLANVIFSFVFTDITRSFESIVDKTNLTIISDTDADFNGNFRIIRLTKN